MIKFLLKYKFLKKLFKKSLQKKHNYYNNNNIIVYFPENKIIETP